MKERSNKLSYSTPKSFSSKKRTSVSKSKKSELQNYLNDSIVHKIPQKNQQSTSAQFNPEFQVDSPINMLNGNHYYKKKCRKVKQKKVMKTNSGDEIENALKQDIKLRVLQSVQLGQWMEMLRQYKCNIPNKRNEANVILRQFQKIMELKQNLQIRKYRLISSLI